MDKETKGAIIAIAPVMLIIWLVVGCFAGFLMATLAIIGACLLASFIFWWIDFVFKHFI